MDWVRLQAYAALTFSPSRGPICGTRSGTNSHHKNLHRQAWVPVYHDARALKTARSCTRVLVREPPIVDAISPYLVPDCFSTTFGCCAALA